MLYYAKTYLSVVWYAVIRELLEYWILRASITTSITSDTSGSSTSCWPLLVWHTGLAVWDLALSPAILRLWHTKSTPTTLMVCGSYYTWTIGFKILSLPCHFEVFLTTCTPSQSQHKVVIWQSLNSLTTHLLTLSFDNFVTTVWQWG